jgi:hypothetical protein
MWILKKMSSNCQLKMVPVGNIDGVVESKFIAYRNHNGSYNRNCLSLVFMKIKLEWMQICDDNYCKNEEKLTVIALFRCNLITKFDSISLPRPLLLFQLRWKVMGPTSQCHPQNLCPNNPYSHNNKAVLHRLHTGCPLILCTMNRVFQVRQD